MEELMTQLDKVNEGLALHGGSCEILELELDGTLHIRLNGGCAGCPSSTLTLWSYIQPLMLELPQISEVVLHG